MRYGNTLVRSFAAPVINEREILRYARADESFLPVAREVLGELALRYDVCYRVLPVKKEGNGIDFGVFGLKSRDLTELLNSSERAVVFASTVGIAPDRAVLKYGKLSPVKALFAQAIGAERIEALCDEFCAYVKKEISGNCTPRFSPGYGDLELSAQRDIFACLECERRIGVTLNESLLMTPTKSVTAIMGI